MKKLLVSAIAVLLVAFSAVPAFAATVASPVATQPRVICDKSSTVVKDSGSMSPKTGSDALPFAVIALSAVGCASAAVVLAKSKAKKNWFCNKTIVLLLILILVI